MLVVASAGKVVPPFISARAVRPIVVFSILYTNTICGRSVGRDNVGGCGRGVDIFYVSYTMLSLLLSQVGLLLPLSLAQVVPR